MAQVTKLTETLTVDELYAWRGKVVKCICLPGWEDDAGYYEVIGKVTVTDSMEGWETEDCLSIETKDLQTIEFDI